MKARAHAILALVLVFLVGCLTGAGGIYAWLEKTRASDERPVRDKAHYKASRLELEKKLKLSEQQKVQFAKIMDDSRQKFSAARKESSTRFDEIRKDMRSQLQAILTEEQNREFESHFRQKEEAYKKHRYRHE